MPQFEPYEGSARQRRRQRKVKVVAIILSLSLLVPILLTTADAISG